MKSYIQRLSEQQTLFRALSDLSRLRLVHLLLKAGVPICQCELVDALQVSPANVSRHVNLLIQAGILQERKEGKWVYYAVVNRAAPVCKAILQSQDNSLREDERRLGQRLKLRKGGKCLLGVQSRVFRSTERRVE